MKKSILLLISVLLFSFPAFASSPEEGNTKKEALQPKEDKIPIVANADMTEQQSTEKKLKQYGIGLEVHTDYIPEFFLHIGLRAAHDVKGNGFGIRGIFRKKLSDITVKLNYFKYDAPNGNWLGITGDWPETDYVEFDNLSLLYAELAITWNSELMKNFYFIYGGGIGGGLVMGDIYTTPTAGCTSENWRSVNLCTHLDGDARRTKEDIPRGMGVLEGFVGLRYDITKNITVKGEVGVFLPGFLRGTLALEFLF